MKSLVDMVSGEGLFPSSAMASLTLSFSGRKVGKLSGTSFLRTLIPIVRVWPS